MKSKTLFILFVTFFSNLSFSQKVDKVDTLKIASITPEVLKGYKNRVAVNTLVLPDKSLLSKGSVLVMGVPSNPLNINRNVYNGMKVAETSNDFSYVFVDKFSIFGAMTAPVAFSGQNKGTEILVDEIILYKNSSTFGVIINFTRKDGKNTGLGKYGNIRDLMITLQNGEIINPNASMTREEAIKKLKEAKDLLDLDMMKKEEYESLKEKLAPIIKSN